MNSLQGEVPLKCGEREYKLKCSTNSLCFLEDLLKMGIQEILIAASSEVLNLNQVRKMLYCAAMEHHEKEIKDLNDAGKVMDEAGSQNVWVATVKATALSLPDVDEKEKKTVSQIQ